MYDGWVCVYRKIVENPLWLSEKFTKAQAWIDLLLLANHKDNYIMVRGVQVPVNRGQIGWSESRLSTRWKWSRTKVKNYLNLLEKEQQIKQETDNVTSIITVVNYDHYQEKNSKKSSKVDSKKAAEEQQKDPNNNDNNENNKNITFDFDSFWGMYGKKTGREKCEKVWSRISQKDKKLIFESLPAYIESTPNKQYRKAPLTWLNGKYWHDELETNESAQQDTGCDLPELT